MNRYEHGKIYRLVGSDGSFYIGSTCMPLVKRMYGHKQNMKRYPDRKVYKHLNDLGWDNVKIVLIRDVCCTSKEELIKQEQLEIDKFMSDINCLNFIRSHTPTEVARQRHITYMKHKRDMEKQKQSDAGVDESV